MKVRTLEYEVLGRDELDALLDRSPWDDSKVLDACREIVEAVRTQGDVALLDCTRRFDGVELTAETMRVGAHEFDAACASIDPALRESLDYAIDAIRRVHEPQRPDQQQLAEVDPGVWCGERWTALDAVCLYVPRGRGAFSSVACMLAVPAVVAGVGRPLICTPPGPDGSVDAATLYAARRIGIEEIYRVGGAQAVAAVAFGTERVPRCDKIVGPGNVWVSGARRLLSGRLDPGPPAGPSESLIVGDGTADPSNVAWNLLIEAEHGENSCAWLVTHDRDEARAVTERLPALLETMSASRRDYAVEVLAHRGGIMLTSDLDASCEFANRFAGEHVALMVAEPWSVLPRVRHAGEILFGDWPIMSLANYAMGINAILPTGGWARSGSGVSVLDFMKRSSIGFLTRAGFEQLRELVPRLSRDEGFSAHHLAIEGWSDPADRGGGR